MHFKVIIRPRVVFAKHRNLMHQTGVCGLAIVKVLVAVEVEFRFVGLRLGNGRLRLRGFFRYGA